MNPNPPNSSHPTSLEALKVCPTCQGEGKLFCAICGEWGNHRSGGCPAIPHNKPEILEAQAEAPDGHSGDCTIYTSLVNGLPSDGICTCGFGLRMVRKGNWDFMYSKERQQPEAQAEKSEERRKQLFAENGYRPLTSDMEKVRISQDAHYQPIVERLRAELNESEHWREQNRRSLNKANDEIEQLTAELEKAKTAMKAYENGLGEIERCHECSKDIDCVVCNELCSIPQWIEFKDSHEKREQQG